nr:replication protein A 70 kDa DNA-binding subunit B [Tanacetum cinerariifolium]
MILQLARVKYFNDKASVSNYLFSTKLYINEMLPEIVAFSKRYQEIDGYDEKNHSISLYSHVKKEITIEEFFVGGIKKMVGAIRESGYVRNTNALCMAKFTKFTVNMDGLISAVKDVVHWQKKLILVSKMKTRKGQNRDKTGQKQEAWRSPAVSKANHSRESKKSEENASSRDQICKSYKVILKEESSGTEFAINSKYKKEGLFCQGLKVVRLKDFTCNNKHNVQGLFVPSCQTYKATRTNTVSPC